MVSIVIPARNESASLAEVIDSLRRNSRYTLEIIVADSASQDETPAVARQHEVKLVNLSEPGKGRAMQAGIQEASGDIIVFIDGDGSYSSQNIDSMIALIRNNRADVVYGSRFLSESTCDISSFRRFGNRLFQRLGRIRYGYQCDFLSGLIAIRVDDFATLGIKSVDYRIEAELFIKCCSHGYRISEVPIRYQKGHTSQLHPLRDGWLILLMLLGKRAP